MAATSQIVNIFSFHEGREFQLWKIPSQIQNYQGEIQPLAEDSFHENLLEEFSHIHSQKYGAIFERFFEKSSLSQIVYKIVWLAVCSGCRSCPLFQDGVASLAQVSVSCGLGDVVSHPAGRSVVNEHFFFLCEGNYSIPLAIRQ